MKKFCSIIAIILTLAMLAGCGAQSAPAETPKAAEVSAAPATNIDDNTEAAGEEAAEDPNAVRVSSVDELLEAIAPDAHIILAAGTYDLSAAKSCGKSSTYYQWDDAYDGYELKITGVKNLTIEGESAEDTIIAAVPRYANVIRLNDCEGITLRNLTLGHTEEPGECAGGVVQLWQSNDVAVEGCALYGCGILGVSADECSRIRVVNTKIYDCSQGAVQLDKCSDVSVDGCEIYDCSGWGGTFYMSYCGQVGIINNEIYNCTALCAVSSQFCRGVYFGGNEVRDNEYEYVFSSVIYPISVEKCSFKLKTSTAWTGIEAWSSYKDAGIMRDGRLLEPYDLYTMEREKVTWQAAEEPENDPTVRPEPDSSGVIHVTTVDEFLASIACDTTIYLEPGVYDLSAASDYGFRMGDAYRWEDRFDGPGLIIHDISGLTITGAGIDKVTLAAKPRYADVISFENCEDITLSSFTAGHTEEPGACSGGVLYFNGCDNAEIDSCSLFGCGILGITANNCRNLLVHETEIYDCSYGGVSLIGVNNASFDNCSLHDNGGPDYSFTYCANVTINGAKVDGNATIQKQ